LFGGTAGAFIIGSNNVSGNRIRYGSNPWSSYVNDFIAVSVVYTNYIRYYLNGVAKELYSMDDSIGGSQAVTRIGNRTTTYPFHGNIYAIRVYDKQLIDEEVAANNSIDKQRFNLP
jgi:hypothetical protein